MRTALPFETDLGLRDLAVGLLAVVAVASTIFAQLLWMIAFDEAGFDQAVPDAVFTVVLPALTLAAIPTAAAAAGYDRRRAAVAGAAVLVASAAVATQTVDFFGVCGRGC